MQRRTHHAERGPGRCLHVIGGIRVSVVDDHVIMPSGVAIAEAPPHRQPIAVVDQVVMIAAASRVRDLGLPEAAQGKGIGVIETVVGHFEAVGRVLLVHDEFLAGGRVPVIESIVAHTGVAAVPCAAYRVRVGVERDDGIGPVLA